MALAAACDGDEVDDDIIAITGSSTVYPITEAVADEFQHGHDARITISVSGTGGGLEKLCRGEAILVGASRPIAPSEAQKCAQHGIEYIELPIAYDGITVVIHPDNDWAQSMTVAELRKLFRPEAQGEVTEWSDVRPDWPDREIHLFGPGVDSGTYDYFTAAIVGEAHASRGDLTSSEDDNVLVQGIATDPLALGFFSYAYFDENRRRLRAVSIDDEVASNGKGPIAPSQETISAGTYQPLSRPVFLYVQEAAASRKDVQELIHFYLDAVPELAPELGYVALSDEARALVRARFERRQTGSAFGGRSAGTNEAEINGGVRIGVTVEEVLGGA